MLIRKFQESDFDDVFQLYEAQSDCLPFHHRASAKQFRADLLTTRYIRDPADHDLRARIALVACADDRVQAFVSGGMVVTGDEVVSNETAYIQAVIARRTASGAVRNLIQRVIAHLREFNPGKIVAHDGCLCPVFFADSAGSLPSAWAWIGQCLVDSGFQADRTLVRLVAPLDKPRPEIVPPDDLKFLHIKHEMKRFDPEYDFGCLLVKPPYEYGDGVVWCGNFYSGAFVTGTGCQSLYMNYFSILDEACRGRGLGRLVLQHCLREARQRGAQFASLLTDSDNFVAQSLYQSEGFDVVDVMHSFLLSE